jgi:hypothetical protein
MKEVNVTVSPECPNPTVTLLEGKTLDLKHPVQIKIDGNIQAISNFLKRRYAVDYQGKLLQEVNKELAIVVVDDVKMEMQLMLDPQNVFGTVIRAELLFTPELQQFHINNRHKWTRKDLLDLLRFNRRFFADPSEFEKLIAAYQRLNLNVSSEIIQASDSRGNREDYFKKVIDSSGVPTEFTLKLPIFKGERSISFRVEVCIDATEGAVKFWLESPELVELIETEKHIIFKRELENCVDFPIIFK